MSYVLFDIGGSYTRVAVSEDLQSFTASTRFKTPVKFTDGMKKINEEVKKFGAKDIRGVAGGVRGILNEDKTEIVHDEVLDDWVEKPLVETLKMKLSAEVYLENDAALAGMGEAVFGAGKGNDIVVYHTISTGVGGAKIEDGIIDDYRNGFEPGLQILDIDHTILGEDIEPTLENLISGNSVEKRMGMKPIDIPQDDAIWDQLALYLAHGLRNSILYWSPDVIVLGGAMILGKPSIQLDAVVEHTNKVLGDVVEAPLMLEATLGDESALYGAMALLNQKV